MKNALTFIGLLAGLIFIAWYLFTYVLISDEDKIYRVILKGKTSIESGSILSLPAVFAPHYSDSSGADKAMVIRSLYSMMDNTEERTIQITAYDVQVDGETATATLSCRFDFVSRSGRVDDRYFNRAQILLELTKIQGRWKIAYSDILQRD